MAIRRLEDLLDTRNDGTTSELVEVISKVDCPERSKFLGELVRGHVRERLLLAGAKLVIATAVAVAIISKLLETSAK